MPGSHISHVSSCAQHQLPQVTLEMAHVLLCLAQPLLARRHPMYTWTPTKATEFFSEQFPLNC